MKYYYRCQYCGGRAFLYDHWPGAGEVPLSRFAAHIDGRPMGSSDEIKCDSCSRPLFPLLRVNLIPEEAKP